MKRKINLLLVYLILTGAVSAGNLKVSKIEPPNWWIGMKNTSLQIMVYGESLDDVSIKSNNSGIIISKVYNVSNPDYCFIDLEFSETLLPGKYELTFQNDNADTTIKYELLSRDNSTDTHKGFEGSDIIYLITPDRFCDGDTSNNIIEGYKNEYNRNKPYGRHGGDIQGIINKLGYLKELGITAIWINPLTENNTNISYHGYAATNLYNIDPRFGSNKLYRELVDKAHAQGIKVIMDHVSNHISIDHPWMQNLPADGWINGSKKKHLNTKHHKLSYYDPYASARTIEYLNEGWFTDHMPDLNQRNEFVSKYLIQNTIWWIEYSGIDGIREDTYPYAAQNFLAELNRAILEEYPNFNIVGEVWTGNTAFLAPYQGNSRLPVDYNTYLPAVTDFGLREALAGYLKGNNSLYKVYEVLAKDYLYESPYNLVTFIDNHDIERVMFAASENVDKAKLALSILFTTRGIPQILYATEIGMVGTPEHGLLRSDFPGGFPGDSLNSFTQEGRSDRQNEMFNYLQKLIKIRKGYSCFTSGKMIHYPPERGVYLFTRQDEQNEFFMIFNGNGSRSSINLEEWDLRFDENYYYDLLSESDIELNSEVNLEGYEAKIIRIR